MPPSALPDGDPAPPTGELPASALTDLASTDLGLYVHVPFCSVRCGYCDFNTYTLTELGGPGATIGIDTYADAALRELDLAADVLGVDAPPVSTVFVGGGTPTMLRSGDLVRVLGGVRDRFGLAPGAEVTTEANPDSVSSESLADWRTSLETAIALEPDHVSAYALVVEEGTRLAAQVRRGLVPAPEDDDEADKYELADELLSAAGFGWYEVSNWARDERHRCRHNIAYWAGTNWWGIGPGAHSHVGGVRWWNVKHPSAYAQRLATAQSPAAARELLDDEQRYDERVLLGTRLVEGLPVGDLRGSGRAAVAGLVADGLVDGVAAVSRGRVVLTRRGRLLADTVVHRLLAA